MLHRRATQLLREFFISEEASGIILITCTIFSILITNFYVPHFYPDLWKTHLNFSISFFNLNLTLSEWINDGLMAIFFLMVGLEIKRELLIGKLSSFRQAMMPAIAALGGMIVPGIIYTYFNFKLQSSSGFGIPMATDIAFALGVLSLVGKRVPLSLKIFLMALAIIDDLGAVVIIGLFYSQNISFIYMGFWILAFIGLMGFNRMGGKKLIIYLLGGIFMWYCMLHSGIHPTISGILLAFALPFGNGEPESLCFRVQHFLHKPVAFLILPLFALSNTALLIASDLKAVFFNPVGWGIILGLFIGKPIGICGSVWLLVKTKCCILPNDINWTQLFGVTILGGVGFTMSIFITNLAFTNDVIIQNAKLAILLASTMAAITGFIFLKMTLKKLD